MGGIKIRIEKLEKLFGSDELDAFDKFCLGVCQKIIDAQEGLELIRDCHVKLLQRYDSGYFVKYVQLKNKLGFVGFDDVDKELEKSA